MNVATAAPSGRENEAKNGMNAAGLGIPGIPKTKKKFSFKNWNKVESQKVTKLGIICFLAWKKVESEKRK